MSIQSVISLVPQQPQRQDGTNAQLADLRLMAIRMGCYDAADLIKIRDKPLPSGMGKDSADGRAVPAFSRSQ